MAAREDGGLEGITRPGLQRLRSMRGAGERLTTMDMDTRIIVTGDNTSGSIFITGGVYIRYMCLVARLLGWKYKAVVSLPAPGTSHCQSP